jgi:hypothetical protein
MNFFLTLLLLSTYFIYCSYAIPTTPTEAGTATGTSHIGTEATPNPIDLIDNFLGAFIPVTARIFSNHETTSQTPNIVVEESDETGNEIPSQSGRDGARDDGELISSFFNLVGSTAKDAINQSQGNSTCNPAEIVLSSAWKMFQGLKRIVRE